VAAAALLAAAEDGGQVGLATDRTENALFLQALAAAEMTLYSSPPLRDWRLSMVRLAAIVASGRGNSDGTRSLRSTGLKKQCPTCAT
jgi:hypothetical protein